MILTTKNLGQRYGEKIAVQGLNLQVEKGSLVGLLGPNGAGKSTTMRMLIGLTQPSTGEVVYENGTRIGVVFQESVLDGNLTVIENLRFRARQYRNFEPSRLNQLIEKLGLKNFQKQKYQTLSGGQKRRVDIARALLNQPDILFLDEPTTGLDIQTRRSIWTLLHQLQVQDQLTIILTTHYLDEADHADSLYIIDHGQVIAQGSAATIKAAYAGNRLILTTVNLDKLMNSLTATGYQPLSLSQSECQLDLEPAAAIQVLTTWHQELLSFEYRPGTMDDAFVALTGQEVR